MSPLELCRCITAQQQYYEAPTKDAGRERSCHKVVLKGNREGHSFSNQQGHWSWGIGYHTVSAFGEQRMAALRRYRFRQTASLACQVAFSTLCTKGLLDTALRVQHNVIVG